MWILDRQLTTEDLILIVSLFFNLLFFITVLVLVDVRFANWRRRREWQKMRQREGKDTIENLRNPAYGMKPRDDQ